jgi:origin recognition complex subunit 1
LTSFSSFLLQPTRDVFEIDAIRFAARKTANRTGDIRKAFNLCKVAAESVCQARIDAIRRGVVTSEEHRPIVSTKDVVRASNDAPSRIMIKAMKCSTDYQACLLIALGSNLKGREDQGRVTYRDLRNKMVSLANSSGDERYSGVT